MTAAVDEFSEKSAFTIPEGIGTFRLQLPSSLHGFIDIETYYSPALTSTLIDEHDLLGITPKQKKEFCGITLTQEFHGDCTWGPSLSILCRHIKYPTTVCLFGT